MKLIGYYPDYDPTIEGVITDCHAFVPSEKGFESALEFTSVSVGSIPASPSGISIPRSGASLVQPDGSVRTLVGSSKSITGPTVYDESVLAEWTGASSWTKRLDLNGLDDDQFWTFTQFGDYALAGRPDYEIYESASGAFTAISGSPKARIIETCNNFVFAFNTDEATYGVDPLRWWCSAINDHTDWTPSIATQCATGQLTSSAGGIVAAKSLGEYIVAYKNRSIYLGVYVGAPAIWTWRQIQGNAGAISQNAVVDIGTPTHPVHLFMGADNFWLFDGTTPVPIGDGLNQTVFSDLDASYGYKVQALHDPENYRVHFYYPSTSGGGSIDKGVVYHYRKKQWGRDDGNVQGAVFTYYPNAGDDHEDIGSAPAYMTTAGTSIIHSTLGNYSDSSFTTGDLGDDENYYLLQRVKPRWITKPTSATMVNYYKDSQGDALTEDVTTTMVESRFDVLRSARNHRFKFNTVGKFELNQINITYDVDGEE